MAAALFAAFPSAHANVAVGDVSANAGFCVDDGDATPATANQNPVQTATDAGAASGTAVTVVSKLAVVDNPDTTEDETAAQVNTPLLCSDSIVGMRVKITPNGTTSPLIEALAPSLAISTNDSDGTVKTGSSLDIWFTFKNSQLGAATAPNIATLYVQGATSLHSYTGDATGADYYGVANAVSVPVPAGTPSGEYVISAATIRYDHDANAATPTIALTDSLTINVTDAGVNAATATLALGNETPDNPLTTRNEAKAETGSTSAGGDIWLKLSVSNSLGEPSNSSGINTITVIAPGAELSLHQPQPNGNPTDAAILGTDTGIGSVTAAPAINSISVNEDADAATADAVGRTMFVKVKKAGNPPKPGMVEVYALVIGSDGAPRSETVTLNFTGSAAVVVLGDDVSVGKPAPDTQNQAEISLGATDSGGNKTAVGTVGYKVTNADGDAVSQSMIKAETSTAGSSTDTTADDGPAKVVLITVDDTAKPGVYTIEASIAGVKDSADTATVTISGAAANVELSADQTSSDTIGDVITVTATITDADGNSLADGQLVTFAASGKGLTQIGTDASGTDLGFQSKTKGGQATATFAVTGEGTAVVSAVIGSQTAVVVITSTAGAADAADDEPSLGDLSGTSGLVSYSGPDATASELMALLAGRASSIWLSVNGSWVLYASVDGAMVPGSSDFTVTSGDVLYISN